MTDSKLFRSGVVGLSVLLIMSVVMTVGLAVATQSLSQQRQSRQQEDAEQALNLAEAGLEQILSDPLTPTGGAVPGLPGVEYRVSVQNVLSGAFVGVGHTIDIALTGSTTAVTIDWNTDGASDVCSGAALVVAVINSDGSLKRGAYDSCATRSANNSFLSAVGNSVTIDTSTLLSSNSELMRIKPVYYNANISVSGTNLPEQSYLVTTTATLDDGTSRTVEVQRSLPMLPSIFDYVLFSGTSIN